MAGDAEHAEAEGTGETVGEARWAALRELERRHPGLDREAVEYVVVSEGERGLLGVGREPARVLARAEVPAAPAPAVAAPADPPPADGLSEPAAKVREVVTRIAEAI